MKALRIKHDSQRLRENTLKDRKYTDVSAKFPPIPRLEILLFTVWDQRAKAHSGPEFVTVSLGWADRKCHWGLINKDDFMGQDAEEREPEWSPIFWMQFIFIFWCQRFSFLG